MHTNKIGKAPLLAASSALALMAVAPHPALAQANPPTTETDKPPPAKAPDSNVIVVIGSRTIIASLKDIIVEDTYDEDAVGAFGVGSVGEVLDSIKLENGDDDPAILVNGRPISNPDEIANLPTEAISRIEVLPRGSATQIGGQPGQRAYNVVLRPSLRQATLTASLEEASEGGWRNSRGEMLFTAIKGQDRLSLTLRGAKSTSLLESERDFAPRAETTPHSPIGNIIPANGVEIDPVLSALFGQPVSIVALSAGNTAPSLASLLPGANRTNGSEQSNFRTLRGPSRPVDIALSGNKTLNSWLSLSINARLNWTSNENVSGLPSARFLIPQTNPFSPFSVPVSLALNDPLRPLLSLSSGNAQSFSATMNGQRGPWRAALTGKWDRREQTFLSQFTGPLGALSVVAPGTNPFARTLAASIPISSREGRSRFTSGQLQFEVQGPVLTLWAGPVSTRGSIATSWIDYDAEDPGGPRTLRRNEFSAKAGITVPLTSKQFGFLPQLGESEIEFDYGASDLGIFGKLQRRTISFNWQPSAWFRLAATDNREERAVAPELLAAPIVAIPNVSFFDPLTGQTSEVTLITGGASGLAGEDWRSRSVAITVSPAKKYQLQFNAEYAENDLRNQVGPLPLPSSAVVAAFPERFVRDGLGNLILVDSRSINFTRQRSQVVRLGLRFVLPLTGSGAVQPRDSKGVRRRTPPLRLAFSVNHSILLESKAVIRAGLPEVDLLSGGAVGIGGGQSKHSTRASLALTRGSSGLRIDYARRGSSALATGTLALPDRLQFAGIATLDIRAFADLDQLLPKAGLPKGTRITVVIDNLTNDRQLVTNQAGLIPQAYQPVRRDPIGRTVMLELRLVL